MPTTDPGMFLAVPLIAVTKIVFDRLESLKPWGMLLGHEKNEKDESAADGPLSTKAPLQE